MASPLTYRELDSDVDRAFYHDVAPVSTADRQAIRVLDERSSRIVWDLVVGQPVPVTGLVQQGWIRDLSVQGMSIDWSAAWNAADDTWADRTLRSALGWCDGAPVLFIERPTRSIQTTFGVFVRCWRAFLLEDDEGPLLSSVEHPGVVRFSPAGGARVGRRSAEAG